VRVATVCFGLLTAAWSVLTPLAEAPDEPAHVGLVLHLAETGRYPAYDGLPHSEGIVQLCRDYAVSTQWCRSDEERAARVTTRPRRAEDAPPRGERARADDPAFDAPADDRMNQMPQHPPLYYQAMAGALRLERLLVPGEMSVDTEVAFLRLLNVLILLPLPGLAWLTARRLGLDDGVAVVAALLVLAVPQLTHIGGTVNNDNLFTVLVAGVVALLAGVVGGDRSRRTAVLVGALTGLALLTKGFAVVLPPLVVLAYGVGAPGAAAGRRRRLRAAAPAAGGALAVASLVGGWWYVGNLVRTGHVMPSVEDQGRLSSATRPAGFHPDVGEWLGSTTTRMVEGFWGSFGWREVRLPFLVSLAATLVAGLVLVAGRRAVGAGAEDRDGASRTGPASPAILVVLVAPVVALGAFVVVRSAVIYWDTGRLAFQQGRYLFGGLTGLAVLVAGGAARRLGERAAAAAVGVAVVLQVLAAGWCLVGWWGADDVGPWGAVRALGAWSGWPDAVAVLLLAGGAAALALLPLAARRPALPGTSTSSTPEGATATTEPAEPAGSGQTAGGHRAEDRRIVQDLRG
jgi:small subunit ribosomal protein S36